MVQLELFGGAPAEPAPPPVPLPPPPLALAGPTPAYFTAGGLHRRGWRAGAIERFLGAPDAVVPGERGGWSYVSHHYAAARVLAAESSAEFRAWAAARDARRQATERGIQRVRAEVEAWVPVVPRMDLGTLRQLAVDNFNDFALSKAERRGWEGVRLAALDSEPGFLARICVNYLRHHTTSYEVQLQRINALGYRQPHGLATAVKRRALEAIATSYPELQVECARQLQRLG